MQQLRTRQGTAGNDADSIAGQGDLEEATADLKRPGVSGDSIS